MTGSFPDGTEPRLVTDEVGYSEPVEMPQEGFDAIGEYMTQTADGRDDAAATGCIETFHEGAIFFKSADDISDIDGVGRLIEQQATAAPANTVDKAFRGQPLCYLHQMILRNSILSGDFGDRMLTLMGGQIHQRAEGIIGLQG